MSDELDVAALLTDLCKACCLQLGFTSRYGSGLSGTNLYFQGPHLRRGGRAGRFEVQRYSFPQVL